MYILLVYTIECEINTKWTMTIYIFIGYFGLQSMYICVYKSLQIFNNPKIILKNLEYNFRKMAD